MLKLWGMYRSPSLASLLFSILALSGSTWQGPISESDSIKLRTYAKQNCFKWKCYVHWNGVLMLNWVVWHLILRQMTKKALIQRKKEQPTYQPVFCQNCESHGLTIHKVKEEIISLSYLPNPSARAGYETRSIFKRSLTGLNSEFSFS